MKNLTAITATNSFLVILQRLKRNGNAVRVKAAKMAICSYAKYCVTKEQKHLNDAIFYTKGHFKVQFCEQVEPCRLLTKLLAIIKFCDATDGAENDAWYALKCLLGIITRKQTAMKRQAVIVFKTICERLASV